MDGNLRNLDDVSSSLKRFGTADYIVFIGMLVSCSLVGIYFGWVGHRKHKKSLSFERGVETDDYLMGGRNMQVFPVALSLVASYLSGVTLLGTGTEIYLYGTQYCFIMISNLISAVIMHFIVIPVLHEIQVTSMYEYLEKRFDFKVRLFGSIMYIVYVLLKLPIIIYVPALAFNQTTGVDVHTITPIVMSICVFYTCLGGMKAVVWTDVIQVVQMYGVILLIAIKGTMSVGGLSVVIERNYDSGRIEAPDFRMDPTIRHSFWTVVIGGSILWLSENGLNQNMIQRYMALKDVKTARKGQKIYVVGVILMIGLCMYNGLLIYATYYDCDPLTTKLAQAKDQLTALLALEILKDFPGLPGLFIAGVFSASLSSMSTTLNAMSAVVLEDFCKPLFKNRLSERACLIIMRSTVLIIGFLSVGSVYVVQRLGSILQLAMTVPTACYAPLLGFFIIGFMLPWIGKQATLLGGVCGFSAVAFVIIRAQIDTATGLLKHAIKPTSIDGCDYNFTLSSLTPTNQTLEDSNDSQSFHNMSYLYIMPFGVIVTLASALLFSFCFGFEDSGNTDPRLLAPFLRKHLKSRGKRGNLSEPHLVTFKFKPELD